MKTIYRVSLGDARKEAASKLDQNRRAYQALKNKDSDYANTLLALQDLHRQVYEIYWEAPDEIENEC